MKKDKVLKIIADHIRLRRIASAKRTGGRYISMTEGEEKKRADSILVRFKKNVRKGPKCWIWIGTKDKYGIIYLCRANSLSIFEGAHRLSYVISRGSIPSRKNILHKCDNPVCVRPSHLFSGTQLENIRDCSAKGRHGRHLHPEVGRGERNGSSKLKASQVYAMRRLWKSARFKLKDIANKFHISKTNAHQVVTGKSWRHLGGSFRKSI